MRVHDVGPNVRVARMADAVVVNKVDSASPEQIAEVRANVAAMNSRARVILARSALTLVGGDIAGKSVAVVEDGPTLTHGGMTYGAGVVAARRFGASEIVDPVPFAVGELAADDWIREIDGREVRTYADAIDALAAIETDQNRAEFVLLTSRGSETAVRRVKLK